MDIQSYRCCECKCMRMWETDEEDEDSQDLTCQECSHEKCDSCGPWTDCCQDVSLTISSSCNQGCTSCKNYDPKDGQDSEDEDEDEGESDYGDGEVKHYFRKNTEAEKHALIPLNQLLEPVPEAEELVLQATTKFPLQIQVLIFSSYVSEYLTQERVIRAIPKASGDWTYRSFKMPNQIPHIVHGFAGVMKSHAMRRFKSAPELGSQHPYPYFNYGTDLLFLDYDSCGNTDEAFQEYVAAIKSAGQSLKTHNTNNPNRVIKKIKVTYCNNVGSPYHVLNSFRRIPGLEEVTLVAHLHWEHIIDYALSAELLEKDSSDLKFAINQGYLTGSENEELEFERYGFNVKMYDADGKQLHDNSDLESYSSDHDTLDTSFDGPEEAKESHTAPKNNEEEDAGCSSDKADAIEGSHTEPEDDEEEDIDGSEE